MRKKTEEVKKDPLASAIQEINLANPTLQNVKSSKSPGNIVDITTFCDDPNYLDLPSSNFNLWLPQRIILKSFYMGTRGNENVKLTQEEWQWLQDNQNDEERDGTVYEKNIKDVIDKLLKKEKEGFNFSELHLNLGRRSSKCRSEADRIATTEGSITFRELCDRLSIGEKIGACTYDPVTFRRSLTYDIKAQDNGEVECFEVETSRGIKETSSWNHPYYIWRKEWDQPRFVEMSQLLPGDKIAVADCIELFGKGGIGVNRAALLGHLQGDGGTVHQVVYTTASSVMLDDFKRIIASEFPGYVIKKTDDNVLKYDYRVVKSTGKHKQNGSLKNEVKEWLKSVGCFGKKSIHKEVPDCIYKGSKEEIVAFLSRLYGCDGYTSIGKTPAADHGGAPSTRIGYSSSSRNLIDGVRHLLLKFGIHGCIYFRVTKCNGKLFNSWTLTIARQDCINRFNKEINIFSKEMGVGLTVVTAGLKSDSKSEFDSIPIGVWNYIKKTMIGRNLSCSDVVGEHGAADNKNRLRMQYSPSKSKVAKYGLSIGDSFLKNMGSSDIKWDKVKIVKRVGKKNTVSLEVKKTHIIGGDLISHNTILSSIISAYEAYKLLTIGNGNPHKFYGIPSGEDIHIINVALSQDQAGTLFGMIRQRIMDAPFFRDRIANATTTEIRLLTNDDLKKKKKGQFLEVKGSIVILCGHSNPDTLRGKSAVLILFDELAFYDESGKTPGSAFYNALEPSTKKFKQFGDARLVEISTPNTMTGIFYDISRSAKTSNHILSFQLPTWCVNKDIPYTSLEEERKRNPESFVVEYGAQWAKSGTYGNYFDPGLIDRCIRTDISAQHRPQPGLNYYLHVDPANGGDRYVAVMVAKQFYVNHLGKRRIRVILANLWAWDPQPGIGLLFNEIDKDMIKICSIFHPLAVSYDAWNSTQSLQLLRSHGINTIQTSYNRSFKNKIYQNLKDMMGYPQPELWLYDDPRLILEMKALKYRPTMRGISLIKDKHGEVKTDDLCVHPDTIIFTKSKPIEIKDVCIGDSILTADGSYQKITDKVEHREFENIFKIQPYYGQALIATNNHPIETIKDGQRTWKRVDEVGVNDFVLKSFNADIIDTNFDLEKYIDVNVGNHQAIRDYINYQQVRQRNANAKWHNRHIDLNSGFGYIIGMYLAEGSLGNHGITFAGNSNETEILNRLLGNIESVFGFGGKWYYSGNGCQLNINSQILKRFFIDLFKCRISINKYIPMAFMTANYEFQKSMIQGMFDGDGCYDRKGNRILFTTTSIYLAHQIQQLLLRFKVISSFTWSKRKGKKAIICGRNSCYNRDLYNIQITDSKSFNILSKILNLGDFKEQSRFHPCDKYIWGDNFVACKVRKIQRDICDTVVNLSVENNHTYVSGSINSHNCDCLAGAAAMASENLRAALPLTTSVRTGWN